MLEATTLGAAFLAGLATGTWAGFDDVAATWRPSVVVSPARPPRRDRWLEARDEPEDWTFEWSVLGADGQVAFVQGFTRYLGDRPSYDNLWVIRLAPDGRCSSFTEWWMETK